MQFDGDPVEREDAVAAFAYCGTRGDLIERIAIQLDPFARAGLVASAGEDGAEPVIERFFDASEEVHGIKCNCWAATTISPAMGAAAVPP